MRESNRVKTQYGLQVLVRVGHPDEHWTMLLDAEIVDTLAEAEEEREDWVRGNLLAPDHVRIVRIEPVFPETGGGER